MSESPDKTPRFTGRGLAVAALAVLSGLALAQFHAMLIEKLHRWTE